MLPEPLAGCFKGKSHGPKNSTQTPQVLLLAEEATDRPKAHEYLEGTYFTSNVMFSRAKVMHNPKIKSRIQNQCNVCMHNIESTGANFLANCYMATFPIAGVEILMNSECVH